MTKKISFGTAAVLLSALVFLLASGALSHFFALERQSQWVVFLGMLGVTALLWVRMIFILHRRGAQARES
jgi:hypothetical protein